MKLKAIDKSADIKLKGIDAEIVVSTSGVIRIVLKDSEGHYLEIEKGDYSGLSVRVPAPPDKKKVWRLSGKLVNMPIQEDFESDYEASKRLRDLEAAISDGKRELKVEEIEVEVL